VEEAMSFGRGVSPDEKAAEERIDEEMHDLVTQLTNEITWHMKERGLSRADLAARMGVSPGRVSQILGGGENLTLRTLAALSCALDAHFDLDLTSLKAADAYTSADARPAANHHSFPRAQHQQKATRKPLGPTTAAWSPTWPPWRTSAGPGSVLRPGSRPGSRPRQAGSWIPNGPGCPPGWPDSMPNWGACTPSEATRAASRLTGRGLRRLLRSVLPEARRAPRSAFG
jgi:transcriptional regulator with XRE-family HTH domain